MSDTRAERIYTAKMHIQLGLALSSEYNSSFSSSSKLPFCFLCQKILNVTLALAPSSHLGAIEGIRVTKAYEPINSSTNLPGEEAGHRGAAAY